MAKCINPSYQYTDSDVFNLICLALQKRNAHFVEGSTYVLQVPGLPQNNYVLITPPVDLQDNSTPIDYFFNAAKQPWQPHTPDHRTDIFNDLARLDEFFPGHDAAQPQIVKILFPYHLENHWLTAEVKITNTPALNQAAIEIVTHNPYGGGSMDQAHFDSLSAAITAKIRAAMPVINIVPPINGQSPFLNRRQSEGDVVSCGVIEVEDIVKRVFNEPLDQANPYPVGAKSLRSQHKLLVDDLPDTESFKKNYLQQALKEARVKKIKRKAVSGRLHARNALRLLRGHKKASQNKQEQKDKESSTWENRAYRFANYLWKKLKPGALGYSQRVNIACTTATTIAVLLLILGKSLARIWSDTRTEEIDGTFTAMIALVVGLSGAFTTARFMSAANEVNGLRKTKSTLEDKGAKRKERIHDLEDGQLKLLEEGLLFGERRGTMFGGSRRISSGSNNSSSVVTPKPRNGSV